jgi:hypothetical protein
VYGKLIYSLYGDKTEKAFVQTWGIGLAIENATGFVDIAKEAAKGFVVLLLLDMLIKGPARWMEEHIDFMSVQSTMYGSKGMLWWKRMKTHIEFYANNR